MNNASKILECIKKSVGKILVIMGGSSSERDISIQSGEAIHSALCNYQLQSCLYDWSGKELDFLQSVEFDTCFIAVHGRGGEDGKLQAALGIHGKPYTGSGFMASAIAMHKYRTKQIWSCNGLNTPKSLLWRDGDPSQQFILDELGLPLMIKPVREGSSVGVSLVLKENDISAALEKAQKFDNEILIEQFIQGDEYTVSILGNNPLPSIKLETPRQFYDYDAKYLSEDTRYICPSGLRNFDELTISDIAIKGFKALGCGGWGRVDFIRDSSGEFFLIEVNTVPGMTSHSLVPMAALEAGIRFDELVLRILTSSIKGFENE